MFGPHFGRTQRRLKFTDKVMDSEGKLRKVELPGPRDLEQWNQCSAAYECATISVRAFKTTCERQGKESDATAVLRGFGGVLKEPILFESRSDWRTKIVKLLKTYAFALP